MQPHEFGCFLFWVGFFGLDVEDRNGSSYAALRVGLFHTEFFDSTGGFLKAKRKQIPADSD